MTAPRNPSASRRFRTAASSLARRPAAKPGRRPRLAIQSLEDRVVPYSGPIPYEVGDVPGAIVIIHGDHGTMSTGVTDDTGWAYPSAPDPWYGVAQTEFWTSEVILPPGYSFWNNDEEAATQDPVWNPSGLYSGVCIAGPATSPDLPCDTARSRDQPAGHGRERPGRPAGRVGGRRGRGPVLRRGVLADRHRPGVGRLRIPVDPDPELE